MNILNNINALLAKLKPSIYRDYVKDWNKERYFELFNGKYRLYLPDIIINEDIKPTSYEQFNLFIINDELNFFKTSKLNKKLEIKNYTDYIKGIAVDELGREYKVGKLLNEDIKYREENINELANKILEYENNKDEQNINIQKSNYTAYKEHLEYVKSLLTTFNQRPSAKLIGQKLIVVISRHPYDIIGMSSDRAWKSCMELPDTNPFCPAGGIYHDKLEYDVKEGTLVAYLIYENDKNINNPVARIAIKPAKNDNIDIILNPEDRHYGGDFISNSVIEKFKQIVNEWCNKINATRPEGTYWKSDNLYDDSEQTQRYKFNLSENSINNILDFIKTTEKMKKYVKQQLKTSSAKRYIESGLFFSPSTKYIIDAFHFYNEIIADYKKGILTHIAKSYKIDINDELMKSLDFIYPTLYSIDNDIKCTNLNKILKNLKDDKIILRNGKILNRIDFMKIVIQYAHAYIYGGHTNIANEYIFKSILDEFKDNNSAYNILDDSYSLIYSTYDHGLKYSKTISLPNNEYSNPEFVNYKLFSIYIVPFNNESRVETVVDSVGKIDINLSYNENINIKNMSEQVDLYIDSIHYNNKLNKDIIIMPTVNNFLYSLRNDIIKPENILKFIKEGI